MKCVFVQDWLLQCESLRPRTWPRKMARHVKTCAACYEFARSLKKLDNSWRHQTFPEEASRPSVAFLSKIQRLEEGARPASWVRPARWMGAVAAAFIIGVGVVAGLFFMAPDLRAGDDDVVEELIAWNTAISNADSARRKSLLEEQEDVFRKRLKNAKVSADERAIGELLLETGRKLALNDDLVEDEEILSELENMLDLRARIASKKGNKKDSERADNSYNSFVEQAVNPMQNKLRVLDRLLEWNMAMASADAKTRKKLLDENEPSLAKELKSARLPTDELAMAENLLEIGRRLAQNPDPLQEATAITEVANKLLAQAETAEQKGKKKESERFGQGYNMFMQKTVNPFFDQVKAMQAKGPPPKGGFDYTKQKKEFEKLWQGSPQNTRPDMHKRFDNTNKKGPGFGPYGPGFGGPSMGRPKTPIKR